MAVKNVAVAGGPNMAVAVKKHAAVRKGPPAIFHLCGTIIGGLLLLACSVRFTSDDPIHPGAKRQAVRGGTPDGVVRDPLSRLLVPTTKAGKGLVTGLGVDAALQQQQSPPAVRSIRGRPVDAKATAGRERTCDDAYPGIKRTADLDAVRLRYTQGDLGAALVEQLVRYKRKVKDKLTSQGTLWEPYLTADVDRDSCFLNYPECVVFTRKELKLADEDMVNDFMVRKCCIEHQQMLRAVKSLYAAIGSISGASVGAWLTAGTLLGAVREGGVFIPWDTDVDVLVSPQHEAAVVKMLRSHSRPAPSKKKRIVVRASTDDDDVLKFAARVNDEPKEHAHGKLIGFVYGTPDFRHAEASRVEIWVAQETKKMQQSAVNLPMQPCVLYDAPVQCPKNPLDVLKRGYGPFWCVPCKAQSQNCKDVLEERLAKNKRATSGE
jgi:hypothetical protein